MKLSDVLNILTSYKKGTISTEPLLRKLECEFTIAKLQFFIQFYQLERRVALSQDVELSVKEINWLMNFLGARWNYIKNSFSDYHHDLFNPANRMCIALAEGLAGNSDDPTRILEPTRKSLMFNESNVEFEMILSILSEELGVIHFCSNLENIGILFSKDFTYEQIFRCVDTLMLYGQGRDFLKSALNLLTIEGKSTLIQIMKDCAFEQQKYMPQNTFSNREIIIDDNEKNLKRVHEGAQLNAPVNHKKIKQEGGFVHSNNGFVPVNSPLNGGYIGNQNASINTRTPNQGNRGTRVVQGMINTYQMKHENKQRQEYPSAKITPQGFSSQNQTSRCSTSPTRKSRNNTDSTYSSVHKNGMFKHQVEKAFEDTCVIQIPSHTDIKGMKHMPAGSDEDQYLRLENMVKKIEELKNHHLSIPVIHADDLHLNGHWLNLFKMMRENSFKTAWSQFEKIPNNDSIKAALLSTHSLGYLQEIIQYCMDARATGKCDLNGDVIFTPRTFEILMKDIASTFFTSSKIHMSFGLPTHHAYSDKGAGFCILNKVAMLIHHKARTSPTPLHYFIIGTDVNRDNGLCNVLLETAFNYNRNLDVTHVDIFDSRVYPTQGISIISEEFNQDGCVVEGSIQRFKKESFVYYAVDLSLTTRQNIQSIHPALEFAIQQLQVSIFEARNNGRQMALLLPTGWDSHKDETACCGKKVDGKMMSSKSAESMRFNDEDLKTFYAQLFQLYNENSDIITSIYWGLEGGYDTKMYENQIELTIDCIQRGLHIQPELSFDMK